jgi:hypothetical protein
MGDAWETTLHDEILRVERWLERYTNPETPMRARYRSPELLDEDVSRGFENESGQFFDARWQDRQQLVADVCQRRSSILARDGVNPISSDAPLPPGRLLAFDPDNTLSDGASASATDDFFDNDDVPPWNLWLACYMEPDQSKQHYVNGEYLLTNYLICWIPGSLVDLVDFGIEVNPIECFQWLDHVLKAQ